MPNDKSGKFHLNSQKASAADRASATPEAPAMDPGMAEMDMGGMGAMQSPVADLLTQAQAESGGKQMLVQGNEMGGYTAHSIDDAGQMDAQEFENLDALKQHMDQCFGGGEQYAAPDMGAPDQGQDQAMSSAMTGI